jgi:6-phosphogluconolactonase
MPVPGFPAEPMAGLVEFRTFESRSSASLAAAVLLASLIRSELASNLYAQASLVVSGGSTPGPCFDRLSDEALDWSRVIVVPSDERWVPCDDPDSNEHLIRTRLLQRGSGEARVLSFFREGIDAVQAPRLIELDLHDIKRPFSASLLGMGEDGHFASLFPDFRDLKKALEPEGRAQCISVQTTGSPHLRISLTLSALLDSVHTVLLIFGHTKRRVFETASAGGSSYPIEALLHHVRNPLTVIWAPLTNL